MDGLWQPLIICNSQPPFDASCNFGHVITLIQNAITNLIIFSTFLAVAAFIYAGFLLLTSGGNESAKTDAKNTLLKVLKGYIVILAAWLIVYTIVNVLVEPSVPSLLGQPQ